MRRLFLFTLFWCCACAQGSDAVPAPPAAIKVIDTTPAFWNFWQAAEGKPEPARVRLFLDMVVGAHPELFDAAVLNQNAVAGEGRTKSAESIVSGYLNDVAPCIARMKDISDVVRERFGPYAAGFKETFPDFAPRSTVYFTVSLFSFDGATRNIGGKTGLLFGIDGIARYHGPQEDLKVLFDHELFHQYHDQIMPDTGDADTPLWMSLWEEGLATYVSRQMNPGTTDAQVLMSDKLALSAAPLSPALAHELLVNMDSVDPDEYAAFFYGRNKRPDLPPRSGYYMGYRIAQDLGAGRTLQQLAVLKGPPLKAEIKRALEGWEKPR